MYVLNKNGKSYVRLTTPKWWVKTRRRVEKKGVRECSVNVDSTKVLKQRIVSRKHDFKDLCFCQSELNQEFELGT